MFGPIIEWSVRQELRGHTLALAPDKHDEYALESFSRTTTSSPQNTQEHIMYSDVQIINIQP